MVIKVFLQNEKNSCFRERYNEETLQFRKRDRLNTEAKYQYGFIPGTIGEDGDCLDIWLVSDMNYDTGILIPCRILGALEMYEAHHGEKEEDIKIFVCPENENIKLTEEIIREIKDFTVKIFKKFPEITILFGSILSAEQTELLLKEMQAVHD